MKHPNWKLFWERWANLEWVMKGGFAKWPSQLKPNQEVIEKP